MTNKRKRKAKHILFLNEASSEYIFDNNGRKESEELDDESDILNKIYLQKKEKSHKLTKEEFEHDIEEI